ncbi:DUF2612 domain-containing protein [Rhizobium sp. HT1-10]|uniref:DUF2612 domain-containing protein n=1 Tax=Rhizobium sp. HT1-10 TaxID=3111638 RepID=UPI003C22AD53
MTDTGRDYPPGTREAGFGVPFDVWQTVISEYANSPILTQLVLNIDAYLDPNANLNSFYDLVLNLDTAVGYGLDRWGRVVGVNRVLKIPVESWFGFAEGLPGSFTFGQGAFYSGAPLTSNFELSDNAYRLLILAKAASNITNGSIPAINQILLNLFPGRGNCYVTEGYVNGPWFGFTESTTATGFNTAPFYSGTAIVNMTMSYVFRFPLTPVELAIVQQSGVLPKPTGVSSSVVLL